MKSTKAAGTQDEKGKDILRRRRNYSSMLQIFPMQIGNYDPNTGCWHFALSNS